MSNMVWIIVGGITVAAVVVATVVVIKVVNDKKGQQPFEKCNKKKEPSVNKDNNVQDVYNQGVVNMEVSKKDSSLIPSARMVFRNSARRFSDLYEPMFRISKSEVTEEEARSILNEWETGISSLSSESLMKKWRDIFGDISSSSNDVIVNAAFRWLNILAGYGISRDDCNEVVVGEQIRKSYTGLEGDVIIDGTHMIVVEGAWFFDTDVLCKGTLKPN